MENKELNQVKKSLRIATVATVALLGTGTVFYMFFEKLRLVDALYFSTITLTTVGYGDITPQTDIGKLFTCVYILSGIAVLGTFANLLVRRAVLQRKSKTR
ncbi:MAG TPA: potassium channel family protein [Candidatus Saccharibacteria bacterium]|nr:potassium channel family protein [Candidatus Saccharibacteria bacterium]